MSDIFSFRGAEGAGWAQPEPQIPSEKNPTRISQRDLYNRVRGAPRSANGTSRTHDFF